MAVAKEDRGPLWADGQFTVKVRGPGAEPPRAFRVRRPFALIGQIPGADLRIDDPAVDGRHAFLILDRRGLFGVDLLSRTGTRFAAEATPWAWLGPGDIVEIAGRRIEIVQLRVDGQAIDPPLATDDLFAEVHASALAALTLEPLDTAGPPWMLGSALAFVGRGDACVIRIDHASASQTHCALLRTPTHAYVIDLLGRRTLLNDRNVEGASMLLDGDILTVGQARFLVKVDAPKLREMSNSSSHSQSIVKFSRDDLVLSPDLPSRVGSTDRRTAMLAMLLDAADPDREESRREILELLHEFRSDTATLLEAQMERIEALNREIASLRDELQGPRGPITPPAPPLRLDLTPPPMATTDDSASWLLDRLNNLETESRSTWKDLIGRITSTSAPRPGQSLAPTRPRAGLGDQT
jgi:pSer/pThr/pTyr-binding forkhead associated (FHA) protein